MIYENLPKDPFILLSFINMKLRDEYNNLAELCKGLEIDEVTINQQLNNIGYDYDDQTNQYHQMD